MRNSAPRRSVFGAGPPGATVGWGSGWRPRNVTVTSSPGWIPASATALPRPASTVGVGATVVGTPMEMVGSGIDGTTNEGTGIEGGGTVTTGPWSPSPSVSATTTPPAN